MIAARDVEHRDENAEEQDQHQPPEEIGDGEGRAVGDVDGALGAGAAQARAEKRQRHAEHDRDDAAP